LAGVNSKENSSLSSSEFFSVPKEFPAVSVASPAIVKINSEQIARGIIQKRRLHVSFFSTASLLIQSHLLSKKDATEE
jgi:hypothetical protein